MTNDQAPNAHANPLPPGSAFVVHLAVTDTPDVVRGRIEHITTGQWMRFGSSAELIGFMRQILMPGAEPEFGI